MKLFAVAVLALIPTAMIAQQADEVALVKGIYETLNPTSIAQNVEYCGYVGGSYRVDAFLR